MSALVARLTVPFVGAFATYLTSYLLLLIDQKKFLGSRSIRKGSPSAPQGSYSES